MFNVNAGEQVNVDSVQALAAVHALQGSQVIEVDEALPAGATTNVIVGVAATSDLKYLMLVNSGTVDMTTMEIDGSGNNIALKAGESMVLVGPGVAKKVLDLLSGAATLIQLDITMPAGPTDGRVQVVALLT